MHHKIITQYYTYLYNTTVTTQEKRFFHYNLLTK